MHVLLQLPPPKKVDLFLADVNTQLKSTNVTTDIKVDDVKVDISSNMYLDGKGGQLSRRGILLDDDDDDARDDLHNFQGPRKTLHDYFIDLSVKRIAVNDYYFC
ncbi:histone H3.2 [Gossypium australe]|uniref:Histone H3.2 n=1 Tax=Gossypium australe TaxID=47621 RepID=A0A5B6WWF2_9ROSI|nr:histone H3.2 [Gossypium australe]